MKNSTALALALALTILVGCAPQPAEKTEAVAADTSTGDEFDSVAAFGELEAAGSENGQAWFQLARQARAGGDTETASKALERAEALEFSPVRIGFEKARIAVATDRLDDAEAELQRVADTGFTAVQFFVNDPLINSLAGREAYDALVERLSVVAYPCEHQDEFRDFDFWIGEWDVHGAGGQLAGRNSITVAERGCVLLENWTNSAGGTGSSINYLDKTTGAWVQIWNAEGGTQINIRGGLTDEGMLLVGHMHTVANDTTVPFRGLWTPLEDGRVRQFFEQSNDGGKTWQPSFEGFYTRTDTVD